MYFFIFSTARVMPTTTSTELSTNGISSACHLVARWSLGDFFADFCRFLSKEKK